MVIVVMGVSGSGKSSLGEALALALGADFQEGDAFHPPANLDKLHAGIPLDDVDRAPWLARIARWIANEKALQRTGVVSCSALKQRYREQLRAAGDDVRFVYLRVPRDGLRRRLEGRRHFMSPALLDSQLETLEEPRGEPGVLTVDGTHAIEPIVAEVRDWLASGPSVP